MNELKKLPSAISIEELEKLAEENGPSTKTEPQDFSEYRNDVLDFLRTLEITTGENPVLKNTLFLIYKAWSEQPVSRSIFSLLIGQLFRTNAKKGFVYINKTSIKITHDAYVKFKKKTYILKGRKLADNFNDFLRYYSIQSGTYFIEFDFLYLIYTRYVEQKEILKPFSRASFEKYCKVNFPRKRLSTGPAYGVTPNIENFFKKGELKRMRRFHGKKKSKK